MKRKTEKLLDERRCIVASLDSVQARLMSLRELQSATGKELDALLPSMLDRAFKGELYNSLNSHYRGHYEKLRTFSLLVSVGNITN